MACGEISLSFLEANYLLFASVFSGLSARWTTTVNYAVEEVQLHLRILAVLALFFSFLCINNIDDCKCELHIRLPLHHC